MACLLQSLPSPHWLLLSYWSEHLYTLTQAAKIEYITDVDAKDTAMAKKLSDEDNNGNRSSSSSSSSGNSSSSSGTSSSRPVINVDAMDDGANEQSDLAAALQMSEDEEMARILELSKSQM